MIESFVFIVGVSVLIGAAIVVDTKFFLPKRTKAYLETMKAVNEVKDK